MNRESMRKLVCRYAYGKKYDPDTFIKTDWNEMVYRFEHEPDGISIRLVNESRVNFIRQELALLEETMGLLKEMMLPLETKHEKWMVYHDEVFRYRDAGSIEGKPMMEGPEGRAVEDWFGYFYNSLMEYKAYMEKEIGIAAKGDIGEENVARILEKSRYAEFTVHNVVLDVADEGGNTNEIDTFVILPYGVAVLEVKNYGGAGQRLMITDEDKWDLCGKRRTKQVKNPAYQNSRHARATLLTLRKLLGRDIPVFPLIVIGNNQVKLEKHGRLAVKNTDDFVAYLDSLQSNEKLSDEERMRIKKFLESEDIGANAFAVISYREQINHIKAIVKEVFPSACINQEGKVLYYRMRDMVSYGLIGMIAIVLIGGVFIFHNLDSFMVLLLGMCLGIAVIAGGIHMGKKIMEMFRGIMAGDR